MKARFKKNALPSFFFVLLFSVASSSLSAMNWPQYRGPNHNGISPERIRTNWLPEPPRLIWKAAMDPALSSFAISGGKAFSQARRPTGSGEQEFCVALDADTGAELWAVPLGLAFYPNGGVGSDDGPRSTPSIDGNSVYVLTSYLRMACLDAATGQVLWSKDLIADLGATVVPWQNAASPLVVGDLIYLNCNAPNRRLMALRKLDGTIAWSARNDAMTQSSPIHATLAGVPQVIFFTQTGLVSLAPDTGTFLWRYAFPFSTSTAASPVAGNDFVYCSAAYGMGAGAVRVAPSGTSVTATQVWRTQFDKMNHWATPVFYNGYLYGVYGQSSISLRCIELATGLEKWRQPLAGEGGAVLLVSGLVLVLTQDGHLTLVNPDPSGYSEVARFRALDGKLSGQSVRCWNVPAISNGRIYVRSTLEAACYDVAPKPLPKLKLGLALMSDTGSFQLVISTEDGSPLDAGRAGQIDVLATSDLALGPASWTKLSQPPVLTNGQLRIDDPLSPTATPRRFFNAQEQVP